MKPHRNSPERTTMLIERRTRQELREHGVWRDGAFIAWVKDTGVPASINRRTNKPHEHRRPKARHLVK